MRRAYPTSFCFQEMIEIILKGFFTASVYVWGFWSHCSQSLSADRIDCDQPRLAICIERPTAPRPILRMFCQPFRDRVRMHVLELLANFPFTPDIEVIESGLPEAWQIPVAFCKCEGRLHCW